MCSIVLLRNEQSFSHHNSYHSLLKMYMHGCGQELVSYGSLKLKYQIILSSLRHPANVHLANPSHYS